MKLVTHASQSAASTSGQREFTFLGPVEVAKAATDMPS